MALRTIGNSGWSLAFVYTSVEQAKAAWQEATDILQEIGPHNAVGVYRIRLEETGPPYLVIFGDNRISDELKKRFERTGRNGKETEMDDETLLQLLTMYEASRVPGKVTEVHNLRSFLIKDQRA